MLTACEQDLPRKLSARVCDIYHCCVYSETPDDGQRHCPTDVEFYSKNKFEKLVHLVGFIIRTLEGVVGMSMGKISDVNMWSPLTQISFNLTALKMGNARDTSGIRRFLILFFSNKFVDSALCRQY